MCGLVGAMVADNKWVLSKGELDNFTNLLYCSALRGWHSTGIMWWDGDKVHMYKAAMHPADFIFTKEYGQIIQGSKIKAIFGHTRFATSGKINVKNAHPFRVRNKIILMHNGNVISVNGNDTKEFEVDSMALADEISKENPVKVLETFDGAVACIWFNNEDNSVNFYRNYQRPFWMTDTKITNYFASEQGMLEWVIGRNLGINNPLTRPKVKELPPMTLLSVKLDNISGGENTTKVERKYNYSGHTNNNAGYQSRRTWGDGDEWGDDDILGYMPTNRRPALPAPQNHQQQPPLEIVRNSNKPPAEKPLTINNLKNPFLQVRQDGPFKIGESLNFLVYEIQDYDVVTGGNTTKKFRLIATPIFNSSQKQYDNEKYNCVECKAFGYTEEEANKFNGSFIQAKVANIRFNTEYTSNDDRLTVFLHDVKLIDITKGAANGH